MTMRDIERRFAEGVLGPVIMPPTKPTFSPWVFDDSGNFMVCTDGRDGGAEPDLNLVPAFDEVLEDGSTNWCVRHKASGDVIASVNNGIGMSILTGLKVDGHKLTDSEADGMQHELCAYMCALFAMAPKMHDFIQNRVTTIQEDGRGIGTEAEELLHELARLAKT